MKRSDVPLAAVLRAHAAYRAETEAALAEWGAPERRSVWVMLDPDFPRALLPYQRLVDAGFPYKVVMARIMQLVDNGLLDYGTSPHVAFLTDDGRRALAELEMTVGG